VQHGADRPFYGLVSQGHKEKADVAVQDNLKKAENED
jgi:hypothetical protein